jgi:hypothetical protein
MGAASACEDPAFAMQRSTACRAISVDASMIAVATDSAMKGSAHAIMAGVEQVASMRQLHLRMLSKKHYPDQAKELLMLRVSM